MPRRAHRLDAVGAPGIVAHHAQEGDRRAEPGEAHRADRGGAAQGHDEVVDQHLLAGHGEGLVALQDQVDVELARDQDPLARRSSSPAVDGEIADHAADHSFVGRGSRGGARCAGSGRTRAAGPRATSSTGASSSRDGGEAGGSITTSPGGRRCPRARRARPGPFARRASCGSARAPGPARRRASTGSLDRKHTTSVPSSIADIGPWRRPR